MSLQGRWDLVEQMIRDKATELGVPADHISKGAFEQAIPFAPPFVLIGMLPGDLIPSVGSAPIKNIATVEIFCCVNEGRDNAERICAATAMGGTILKMFIDAELVAKLGTDPVAVDTVESMFVAVNVQFGMTFDLFAKPIDDDEKG